MAGKSYEEMIDKIGQLSVIELAEMVKALEDKFGVGPHTISFPRLEPALNAPYTQNSKFMVSDEDLKRMIGRR